MFGTLFDKFRSNRRNDFVAGGNAICVLSTGDSASLAYILEPYLKSLGSPLLRVQSNGVARSREAVACTTIVITRYLPSAWLPQIRRFKDHGGKVIYFMDDDLLDPAVTRDLPKLYAGKIRKLASSNREFFEQTCDQFWVSSLYLAQKYAHLNVKILEPRPMPEVLAQKPGVTVCYHGTASHVAELAWLPEIVSAVQEKVAHAQFEIFGDHQVNRVYRNIRRVAILHPMSWTNYLAYTSSVRRDIALAPLLPQPFNKGRGPTKFFDFVRMGAVGLYTDVPPYRGFVRDGVDGILLPNKPEAWVSAIVDLASDPIRRQAMATAARMRAVELGQKQE